MAWYDPYGKISDFYHRVTGIPTAKERRATKKFQLNEQQAINDQIKAYREQTQIAREELNQKRASELIEKRRINEKQIRALRNNFRAQGLLGGRQLSETDQSGMTSKLGG